MSCTQENNTEKKRLEKKSNYKQLAIEIRERRPGFEVKVVPLVISVFMFDKDDLCERIVPEMQKTILMDSEIIIKKVLLRFVQIY